jgi:hypothetical protein
MLKPVLDESEMREHRGRGWNRRAGSRGECGILMEKRLEHPRADTPHSVVSKTSGHLMTRAM